MNIFLIRLLDIFMAFTGLVLALPVLFVVVILGYLDTGSPIFVQERLGRNKKTFKLIKFRTMSIDTKSVASHLSNSHSITKIGGYLRKTKIDELPQLINVLKGEMSLVGPRPGLNNQIDLTIAREKAGVFHAIPGITGLAQITGVDMSTPEMLAEVDSKMIQNLTVSNYFKYIFLTVLGRGCGDAVKNEFKK